MIDKQYIGHTLPPFRVDGEPGRLRFDATAWGQTDPIYLD